MDHSIIGIVLIIGIAAYGLYKLSQVFLMWNDLGFATQHDVIDRKGLHEWLDGFGRKIAFVNLAAFVALALGIMGVVAGESMIPIAFGGVLVVVIAVGLMALCGFVYGRLYDEFHSEVGLSVEEASQLVMRSVKA